MSISRRSIRTLWAVALIVIAMLLIVIGTARAIESSSGKSECAPGSGQTGKIRTYCSGKVVKDDCAYGEVKVYEFSSDNWQISSLDDDTITITPWDGSRSAATSVASYCEPEDGLIQYLNAVQPLLNPGVLGLTAADGRTPCGAFDLATSVPPTGWGFKTAYLPGWPACVSHSPNLEILCLNGEAQWVTPAFKDVTLRSDGLEFSWTSQQDGTCGFFVTK